MIIIKYTDGRDRMKEKLLKIEKVVVKAPEQIKDIYKNMLSDIKALIPKIKDISATNYKLGVYHIEKGNISDAKFRFLMLTKLKPEMAMAHYHLARCYLFDLVFDKAKEEFEVALSLDPKLLQAQYRLDVLNHKQDITDIPLEVTKEDHDTLSKSYEKYVLNQLDYNVPKILIEEMSEFIKDTDKILDIGCGTGLVGKEIAQNRSIKSLTGVDVSTKMLELSKDLKIGDKAVYSSVKEADFNNLKSIKEKFDVITSCMSFGYANDFNALLNEISSVSYKDSILGFVVLKSESKPVEFNYDYATLSFSEKYLESTIEKCKWSIKKQKEVTVFDDKTMGLLFILEKN
jgi:predicted TPR repeat methyltransferase